MPTWLRPAIEAGLSDLGLAIRSIRYDAPTSPAEYGMVSVVTQTGDHSGFSVPDDYEPSALYAFVADRLQAILFEDEDVPGQSLPACPGHTHPALAASLGDQAWWICPTTAQPVSLIGQVNATDLARCDDRFSRAEEAFPANGSVYAVSAVQARILGRGVIVEEASEEDAEQSRSLSPMDLRTAREESAVLVRAYAFVDFDRGDGPRRWTGTPQSVIALPVNASATTAILDLVASPAQVNDLYADLRESGVPVRRFDFYAAPSRIELDPTLASRLILD